MAAGNGIEKPADIVSTFEAGMRHIAAELNAGATAKAGAIPQTVHFGDGILADDDPGFGGPAASMAQQYTVAVQTYQTAIGQLHSNVNTLSTAAGTAAQIYANGSATEQEAATAVRQQLSGQSPAPVF